MNIRQVKECNIDNSEKGERILPERVLKILNKLNVMLMSKVAWWIVFWWRGHVVNDKLENFDFSKVLDCKDE